MLRALQFRDFSATVLRHTTPNAQRQTPGTRDEHLQVCFLRSRTGAHSKTDSRGTDKYPIQGANRTRLNKKLRLTPVPGREKLTPNRKASSGQVDAT